MPSARLFAGKLLGVGAAGLTQFLVWAVALAFIGVFAAWASGTVAVHMTVAPAPRAAPATSTAPWP